MRLATISEAQAIDELSTREFQLPSEILMEAAGTAAAREIRQLLQVKTQPKARGTRNSRVLVMCGPGHNGGDGLVVARHLHSCGHSNLSVVLLGDESKRSPLYLTQLERCRHQSIEILDLAQGSESIFLQIEKATRATVIIDAIFGIGLNTEVGSPYREVIERINLSAARVVALDVPSGLDSNRGVVLGRAIRAELTLTFGIAKPGFFVSDGPLHTGRLQVLPIGFPKQLVRRIANSRSAFTEKMARRSMPKRSMTSNKSNHGHAAIFAGSEGMWGAALLAANAAYRVGAGYVTVASHAVANEVLHDSPEVLTARIDDEKFWQNKRWTVAGVGPGLGTGEPTYQLIMRLIDFEVKAVVLDADAITCMAQYKISHLPSDWILTPHAGELSRLMGLEAKAIEANRFEAAHEASQKFGCRVLLKGFRTVLAHDGKVSVILSGNSALAKAGTGDVLTGFITGLLAQGLPSAKAAATGAYIHGKIADEWVTSSHDVRSLQASDLIRNVPELLSRLTKESTL